MPWFKVDDAFHSHPKVMELSVEAVGLWTLAGTWCANYLTDGVIKESVLHRFGRTSANVRELCAELVEADLWDEISEGVYQYRNWAEYQPVKDDVEAEREAARERMRQVRARKKPAKRSEDVRANNSRSSEEVRVTPTRPDPIPKGIEGTPAPKRASRINETWMPSKETVEKLSKEFPHIDQKMEHKKFVDHWLASSGRNATKLDWEATYRNWIRRSAEYNPAPQTGSSPWDQKGIHQ